MGVMDMLKKQANKPSKSSTTKQTTAQSNGEQKKASAQHWIPVKDVKNNIAYRRDGHLVMALKVEPINIDLLSKNEVKRIISSLHEVINGQKDSFEITAIGRPVDLDSYINSLQEKMRNTDNFVKKKLLQGYIKQAASMASSGEILERRFYIILSHEPDKKAAEELYNRAKEFQSNLLSCDLSTTICEDKDIIELNFNFTHPAQSAYERINTEPYLPTQVVWD